LNLEYFSTVFKEIIIIVLWKLEKSDYIIFKAYKSIALENISKKIFKSIMTEIINYFTKTHKLLSAEHFDEWSEKSIENILVILSERIHKAWRNEKIFTVVFMNMTDAFNNIHYERLIHNL